MLQDEYNVVKRYEKISYEEY